MITIPDATDSCNAKQSNLPQTSICFNYLYNFQSKWKSLIWYNSGCQMICVGIDIVYFCKFASFFTNERRLSRIRAYIAPKSQRCC